MRKIIKDYIGSNFPRGDLKDFILILQGIQQDYPDAKVSWATGGPTKSDSLYVYVENSEKL